MTSANRTPREKYLLRTGYTVSGAAALVGVTAKHLRKLIRRGALEATKIGRSLYISRADLNAFQKARS